MVWRKTLLNSLTLTINNYSGIDDDWMYSLDDGLAQNTSLKELTLTINIYFSGMSNRSMYNLHDGLALNAFTLTINNYSGMVDNWMYSLGDGLAKNTSIKCIKCTSLTTTAT